MLSPNLTDPSVSDTVAVSSVGFFSIFTEVVELNFLNSLLGNPANVYLWTLQLAWGSRGLPKRQLQRLIHFIQGSSTKCQPAVQVIMGGDHRQLLIPDGEWDLLSTDKAG